MIGRVFAQLSVGDEKYRIAEESHSIIVQQIRPAGMDDLPEEWITMHSSIKSKDGLSACIQFVGLLLLAKRSEACNLWDA